jgi:phage tail sheath protein FI
VVDVDYVASYDDDGQLIITLIEGGSLYNKTRIYTNYDRVDASKVTSADIIGGVSSDGKNKGLEWASSIYTLFAMVPGILAAPGWTEDPTVASVMKAKALTLCGLFRCIVLTDVDTEEVKSYADVNVWKNQNNYTGTNQLVCWPCVRNGDAIYHMSTQQMGIIGAMDAGNEDVPYESPSNLTMQATGACLADGTEVALTLDQANMLNAQGIVTALNFNGGWKSWGNYTGAYPSVTDPKDCFICVRRFFDWQYQTFILSYWQKVDRPLMPRLIKTVIDSEIVRLNGLVARGYLLGADIQFLDSENPLTDLLQGIIRVHSYITPPVPMQECECIFEYDVNNFKALFEAA